MVEEDSNEQEVEVFDVEEPEKIKEEDAPVAVDDKSGLLDLSDQVEKNDELRVIKNLYSRFKFSDKVLGYIRYIKEQKVLELEERDHVKVYETLFKMVEELDSMIVSFGDAQRRLPKEIIGSIEKFQERATYFKQQAEVINNQYIKITENLDKERTSLDDAREKILKIKDITIEELQKKLDQKELSEKEKASEAADLEEKAKDKEEKKALESKKADDEKSTDEDVPKETEADRKKEQKAKYMRDYRKENKPGKKKKKSKDVVDKTTE